MISKMKKWSKLSSHSKETSREFAVVINVLLGTPILLRQNNLKAVSAEAATEPHRSLRSSDENSA
jgi:hypothetical protein